MTIHAAKTILGLCAGVLLVGVAGAGTASEIELRYERRAQARRPAPSQDVSIELPSELEHARVSTGPASARRGAPHRDPGTRPESGGTQTGRKREIEKLAQLAAGWAWRHELQGRGREEYFRVGFYRGFERALRDPGLAAWDFREGVRMGRRDPEALRLGRGRGYELAENEAARLAVDRVEDQFRDLTREPTRDPVVVAPRLTDRWIDDELSDPGFEEVFRAYPIGHFRPLPLLGSLDALTLHRCRSWRDVYHDNWLDGRHLVDRWAGLQKSRVSYYGLSSGERTVFDQHYGEELAVLRHRTRHEFKDVYRNGVHDGWDYGAFAVQEVEYRRGYNSGFENELRRNVEVTYYREISPLFATFYEDAFADWAMNPKVEIVDFRIQDADGDGVFEPGEAVLASYTAANFGGVDGHFSVRLSAPILMHSAVEDLHLPGRQEIRRESSLSARIDARTPIRTETRVSIGLDQGVWEADLRVAYPLELEQRLRIVATDVLGGTAQIRVRATNHSRRPISGRVVLAARQAGIAPVGLDTGDLPPGASTSLQFRLTGFDPLDLLAGDVEIRARAERLDRTEDEVTRRLPPLAMDLTNRDLLVLMVTAAEGLDATSRSAVRMQTLMLRRLEIDWSQVVAAKGNPYQNDVRNGGRETALGDLVAEYRSHPTARKAPIFLSLAGRIEDLSRDLPGTHPLLRRSMRKLAKQLGV